MKHCAKKLLGLAFALALCLAVGGTALAAEAPEFADVPAALPEQEMLDYEPNVTAEPGMNTVTGDGYTVTIPTTVEVSSTTDTGTLEVKGTLEVTAVMKQWRTLLVEITPQTPSASGVWTLKYNGNASAGTTLPQVEYNLPDRDGLLDDFYHPIWFYDDEYKQLSFYTQKLGGSEDVSQIKKITAKLAVTVPHSEQATMSGTYSDILTFSITPNKTCVTYNINVYEQELQLTNNGAHVEAVDVVDEQGKVIGNPTPKFTKTFEYPLEDKDYKWTYSSNDPEDDKLRWQELPTATMNADKDKKKGETNVTFNLNLKRKWYWLDVNGIVGYDGSFEHKTDGNQSAEDGVGCYLDIRASVDGKNSWSEWFSYKNGDDYWGTFPYGTHFEIGFYNPKPGYLYDTDTSGNVKVIANGEEDYTTRDETVGGKAYKIFEGQLTDEPQEEDERSTGGGSNHHADGSYQRYCFNPCFRNDTIIYHGNYDTAGSVTKEYKEADVLPEYDALFNGSTHADMKFAGWSTKQKPTSKTEVYQPGTPVKDVKWGTDDTPKNLYAIWGYDITVKFEDEKGYSTNDGRGPVATLGGTMDGYSFTLEKQVVADDADWTLDLNDPKVTKAIDKATTEAKRAAGDNRATTTSDDVWKTDIEYKLSAAEVKRGKPLVIKRRRYLLSVISANIAGVDDVVGIATQAGENKFGTFNVTINDGATALGVTEKSHCQLGLNYGAKYTVDAMTGIGTYKAMEAVILRSLKAGDEITKLFGNDAMKTKITSYESYMTGKQTGIHYYKDTGDLGGDGYTGDPVRVAFMFYTATTKPGSDTPATGPSLAPAKKALTLRYHANFDPMEELALDLDPDPLLEDMDDDFGFEPAPLPEDVDDALEEAVKIVTYKPGEDVVLRNCMFKRGGYVFVGWNTEPDGTGRLYRVNGVPITDWAVGDTVDLYAQWKKPEHLKPVVDSEPFVPADPDTPPEWVDDGFDADFGADPDPLPEGMDDAFGVDPAAQPEALDDAFGV